MKLMWHVYILRCKDDSLYTGVTIDFKKRVVRHNSGKGASYTKFRRPVVLEYAERFGNKSEAQKREFEVKKFSRENKERLIRFGTGIRFPSPQKIEM